MTLSAVEWVRPERVEGLRPFLGRPAFAKPNGTAGEFAHLDSVCGRPRHVFCSCPS